MSVAPTRGTLGTWLAAFALCATQTTVSRSLLPSCQAVEAGVIVSVALSYLRKSKQMHLKPQGARNTPHAIPPQPSGTKAALNRERHAPSLLRTRAPSHDRVHPHTRAHTAAAASVPVDISCSRVP